MKNISLLIFAWAFTLVLVSCGGASNNIDAKKAELEKLRAEQTELVAQIAKLEKEIASSDTTQVSLVDARAKVVALTAVKKQIFIHGVDVQGKVDGDENITYSAKVPSVVTKINVKVGQQVSAGQVLAELDTKIPKSQLEAYKKQYELVKILYEKRKELWDQKVGSEIEYLQAKNQKESLEKQIISAQEMLDMYYIRADYNGTVDVVSTKVGQNVAPGLPCITVVNPSKLKVKANLSEAYASTVKVGNPVSLNFPDINKKITATISHSSKSIDAMTRTFEVEINLPTDHDLNPNMVAELQIINYQKAGSIVVPINAIQNIDNATIVFVAVKNANKLMAKKVTVEVGKQYNGVAEILAGLNEGDELITTGFQDLTDGQVIKL